MKAPALLKPASKSNSTEEDRNDDETPYETDAHDNRERSY